MLQARYQTVPGTPQRTSWNGHVWLFCSLRLGFLFGLETCYYQCMSSAYKVDYYLSSSGENPAKIFLDSISERERAKVFRIFQNIQIYGLQSVLPHLKKLSGTSLWEIRVLGKDSIRIIYAILIENTVLILHGFMKKTKRTPEGEIHLAEKRYEDFLKRTTLKR